FLYADPSFFNVFTFPLVEGDPGALNEKTNIVLTVAAAKKYFGSADPLNKVLRINDDKDYRVAAVVADPPSNTQLQFDFIMLMARNFVLLVGLALLIAAPLTWLAASRWLGSFAYRIEVQPWVFLLAGTAGILLAFLTVSYHSLKVGSRNPSETLSTE
ncbi:MAG: ABC transporter permease, partial [Bacteroidetes bacterium]|nr:ABC transporter permease [Bacteroidota bacterium]